MENLPKPLGVGAGWPKTKNQQKLCWHHVVEAIDPIDAAIKAGFSKQTARKKAHAMVKSCWRYCEQLQLAKNHVIEKHFEVTVDSVADEIAYLAFASHKDFIVVIDFDGQKRAIGKPIHELTDHQARAVQSWEVHELKCPLTKKKHLDYRYTLYAKDGSLQHLGKHLGMFNEKIILERRMVKIHKVDLSGVPDKILEKWMSELSSYAPKTIEGTAKRVG